MCNTVSAMSWDCKQSKEEQMAAALAGSSGYMAAWNSVSTRPGEMAATRMLEPKSRISCLQPSSRPVTANLVAA